MFGASAQFSTSVLGASMYPSLDTALRQSRAASYWLTTLATEYRRVSLAIFFATRSVIRHPECPLSVSRKSPAPSDCRKQGHWVGN